MRFKLFIINIILFSGIHCTVANAQSLGYKIELEIHAKANEMVYLVSHWNGNSYASDSVKLSDKGLGTIQSASKELVQGQYMLYIKPDFQLDILIGGTQSNVKLAIDIADISKCTITGSKDTEVLWGFLDKQNKYYKRKEAIDTKLTDTKLSETARKELQSKLLADEAQFDAWVQKLIVANEKDWVGVFLKGMNAIKIPHPNPQNRDEQVINGTYIKEHYFDNIDLNDPRMWSTNYFNNYIDSYLSQWVEANPDRRAEAASALVKKAKNNDTTFKNMLSKFTNESIESAVMGDENTWAHLFEEYIKGGNVAWIDSTQLSELSKNYELLKHNRVGMTAKNMLLTTSTGEIINSNEIKCDFLILYFYDPTCSHCIKQTEVLSTYHEKYKEKGLKVLALNVNAHIGTDAWKNYMDRHKLHSWINATDPEYKSNYWLHYDTSGTPMIYILNKEKTILAKKITDQNIGVVLEHYIKE